MYFDVTSGKYSETCFFMFFVFFFFFELYCQNGNTTKLEILPAGI